MKQPVVMAAWIIGAAIGLACADSETNPRDEETQRVCDAFCDRAFACDDDLVEGSNRTDCMEECFGKVDECADVDERDQGLAAIRECSEDCDGLTACSIEVDIECLL